LIQEYYATKFVIVYSQSYNDFITKNGGIHPIFIDLSLYCFLRHSLTLEV